MFLELGRALQRYAIQHRTTCLSESEADPEVIEKSKVGIFEEDTKFKSTCIVSTEAMKQ